MINGIDISSCKQAAFEINVRCKGDKNTNSYLCLENPYCHFKQLAREKLRKKQTRNEKIENALTMEHLRIAKMLALGYGVQEIRKAMGYTTAAISMKMKPLYARYGVDIQSGRTVFERKKLCKILQEKLYSGAIFADEYWVNYSVF